MLHFLSHKDDVFPELFEDAINLNSNFWQKNQEETQMYPKDFTTITLKQRAFPPYTPHNQA